MTDAPPQPLPDLLHDWACRTIGEDGFGIPNAFVVDATGALTIMALVVPPDAAYRYMLAHWAKEQPREMIFALDRFARPEQGTTLGDLLAGWHFTREKPRPFIIEYQYEPRIVKPVDWENPFWNAGLTRELNQHLRDHLGVPR
ncbi:hypothetical protein COA17_11235 [Sphingomonas ginsenosidimutans]|uniref:Uncharacterized protein n=1 Tax=Sphingomonas ginsenosidimutans TaxID=862134 RepID=A0A2A4HXF5_9SPHN|nr:hypothetical protein [Sphingomonas ginsenosidimutans]PCG08721.1 hypothetical protein COA17_11235 [Sphingomonas ginsenosidimutans]